MCDYIFLDIKSISLTKKFGVTGICKGPIGELGANLGFATSQIRFLGVLRIDG
jgi:hypothetical protein